ncbi:ligase-associated DNA damage response endonuclease PdeM [Novosphingobium sp. Chol11]|uniref:ligase-associated DNA damage response endonuclease PdeM n=1 Tax=Novosphingobium sp. Chol11 TaxID=1385763 RepID=UPI0025F627B4|nr:ligase-associated DNA damage response endonuclease PdeM [Novosphingobium sp. Chol11]
MVPVSFAPFGFANREFALGPARALYWAEERALLVADLHLEKASYFASYGQMLPPYDSRETLSRVARALKASGARRVFCLGDNFHDSGGPDRLEPEAASMLRVLARLVDWVWITGNHDCKNGKAPGNYLRELDVAGVILRHEANPGEVRPELSGHFHPRLRINARGRHIARPCAVTSESKLILPAFGAFTGGMDAADPAITDAMQPAQAIDALVPASGRLARFALWRAPHGMQTAAKLACA